MSTTLLISIVMSITQAPSLDASRFAQLIKSLHQPIHDVTLAYEGSLDVGTQGRALGIKREDFAEEYQGRYSFRASDGASFLDLYQRGIRPEDRQSHKLLQNRDRIAEVKAVPDRKQLASKSSKDPAGSHRGGYSGILFQPGSAERIFFLWYFHELDQMLTKGDFAFHGWEEVDGRQCLRIELSEQPFSVPQRGRRFRFWIDMERGGHPLRAEYFLEGKVALRIDRIALQQFSDRRGTRIWLPTSGEVQSFAWQSPRKGEPTEYHQTPVLTESYRLINGSVVLNQDLKDSDFDVKLNARKFGEFKGFETISREKSLSSRIAPNEVQKRLDQALAEADAQSKSLQASAPGDDEWSVSMMAAVGLSMGGFLVLGIAGYKRWHNI